MDIKNFKTVYHRNGICGAGFWNCSFDCKIDGKKISFKAVIFLDNTNKTEYYAVTSDNIEHCWRGDHFVDDLIALIIDHIGD